MDQAICLDNWCEIATYLLPAALWNFAMTSKTFMTIVTNHLGPKTVIRKVKYYKKYHYFVIGPETVVSRNYDLRFYAVFDGTRLTILTKLGSLQYLTKNTNGHTIKLYDHRQYKWSELSCYGTLYRPSGFTVCSNVDGRYYSVDKIRGEQQHERYIDYSNIRCVTLFADIIHVDNPHNMYTIPVCYL